MGQGRRIAGLGRLFTGGQGRHHEQTAQDQGLQDHGGTLLHICRFTHNGLPRGWMLILGIAPIPMSELYKRLFNMQTFILSLEGFSPVTPFPCCTHSTGVDRRGGCFGPLRAGGRVLDV